MSKSIGAAGRFSRLFRNTKIAQLPKTSGELGLDKSKAFPTHQVIESLPSSFSRRDFGLKIRLPKKLKTRRIVINDLDNKYGLPDFEPLNGFYWKKQRFREFGIPVQIRRSGLKNLQNSITNNASPLFPKNSRATGDKTTIAGTLDLKRQSITSKTFESQLKPQLRKLRRPFFEWLVKNYPDRLYHADLSKELTEFLNQTKPSIAVKSTGNGKRDPRSPKFNIGPSYADKLSGTAGLSYNLGGRLLQTPNGIESSKVLPGRFLQSKITGHHFALGGFVGYSSASQSQVKYLNKLNTLNRPITGSDSFSREFKVPIVPKHAYINPENHTLELQLDPVRSMKRYRGKNGTSLSSIKRTISPRSSIGGNDKETSVLNSLLGLLESVDKK